MKVLVLGNCQALSMYASLRVLLPDEQIDYFRTADLLKNGTLHKVETSLSTYDVVITHRFSSSQNLGALSGEKLEKTSNVVFYPNVYFAAFHPDIVYVRSKIDNSCIQSGTADYNSAIILYAYLKGLTEEQTIQLFCEEIFARLGYFDRLDQDIAHFLEMATKSSLDCVSELGDWLFDGCFMYSVNHPKISVMSAMSKLVLRKLHIDVPSASPSEWVHDPLLRSAVWPVYPEIADRMNEKGSYLFKSPGDSTNAQYRNLESYISLSFEKYREIARTDFDCERVLSGSMDNLVRSTVAKIVSSSSDQNSRSTPKKSALNHHPYKGLPDQQFWKRSISKTPPCQVDPVCEGKFKILKRHRVATAGSCFAQHISKTLSKNGFNYFVAERRPDFMTEEEATSQNYDVFSARYGNIYSVIQLNQLFDRAYGYFKPSENYWRRSDGRLVDPFRPQIQPNGFDDLDVLNSSQAVHFEACREIFESSDVFVFTLGLTETWRSKTDGSVYPLAPGVAGGQMDYSKYEFVNMQVEEVKRELAKFLYKLRQVNKEVKVMLTVSPVPLVATYEKRHVLVSTTYSKSVLLAAAQDISKRNERVAYFPSYEIITGNFNNGSYFAEDKRNVLMSGVDHVMELFVRHYTEEKESEQQASEVSKFQNELSEVYQNELDRAEEVICDEEMLDQA